MESIDTTPEEFTKTVLYAAKHDFSRECKYIPKTRAVKLVCMVADELDYEGFSRGYYKYGYFSFDIYSIIDNINIRKNLYSTKIEKDAINPKLLKTVIPAIQKLKSKFILKREDFLHWVHIDLPPLEYKLFYRCSDDFLLKLDGLSQASSFTFYDLYDDISDAITKYNTSLNHVNRKNLDLFFMYTDILEEIMLVNKSRDLKLSGLKKIIIRLSDLFEEDVYACLPPFKETLKGDLKSHEIQVYEENIDRRYLHAFENLSAMRRELSSKGLLPSLDEYDQEITVGIERMDDSEKKSLHQIFNC
ncbi:MAG: hypothetical protein ACYDDV_10245 [Methanoregula sp.]